MPRLNIPTSPRLIDPAETYRVGIQSQFQNQLRLFFNQITNALSSLFGPFGGRFVSVPAGKFLSSTSQTAASTTVAYAVTFNTSVLAAGVHVSGTEISVDYEGYYAVVTELHFENSDPNIHDVFVWLVLNGTAVADSQARTSITSSHGGNPGQTLSSRTHYLELTEGDVLEVNWSTNSTTVSLTYTAPASSPTRPAAPSAIVYVQFVSSDQGV